MCSCGADMPDDMTNKVTTAENVAGKTGQKAAATYTGYPALEPVTLTCADPENSRGLSTAKISHSYGVAKDGKPHQISVDSEKFFESKNFKAVTYDTKSQSKVLYLTFDCGYENGNTEPILDALKKHDVKVTFFVVGNFLETSPEIVKRMIAEGHTVGNHTYHHLDMSSISSMDAFKKETQDVENLFEQITGTPITKFYRPPQGKYNIENLKMAQELGYHTFFWSLAYVDWYQDKQPTKDEAFGKLLKRIHPGAIVLLHSTSSTNAQILDELLTKWEEMGYTIKPLTELAGAAT